VKTPGQHTVEQVSSFLKVTPQELIKTLLYDVGEKEHVAVLVRGDHDVNEAKLARLIASSHVKLSSAATIERLSGAPLGFTGPVKLKGVRLLADHAVMRMPGAVTGANQAEAHLVNVQPGRDFTPETVADLRVVTAQDACPKCRGALTFIKAIEVGHVFKLGTKYTQALGASVQDAAGSSKPMIMGCYGIGINRIVASAVEQGHDGQGIIWPSALAPFQVVISVMEADHADFASAGEQACLALEAAGLEVLLDDREQSPGSKLKDADLIGIPLQVVIGKVWKAEGKLEIVQRRTKEKLPVAPDRLADTVHQLLASLAT
jgi:prolyl-tRNA synthetase